MGDQDFEKGTQRDRQGRKETWYNAERQRDMERQQRDKRQGLRDQLQEIKKDTLEIERERMQDAGKECQKAKDPRKRD